MRSLMIVQGIVLLFISSSGIPGDVKGDPTAGDESVGIVGSKVGGRNAAILGSALETVFRTDFTTEEDNVTNNGRNRHKDSDKVPTGMENSVSANSICSPEQEKKNRC